MSDCSGVVISLGLFIADYAPTPCSNHFQGLKKEIGSGSKVPLDPKKPTFVGFLIIVSVYNKA